MFFDQNLIIVLRSGSVSLDVEEFLEVLDFVNFYGILNCFFVFQLF